MTTFKNGDKVRRIGGFDRLILGQNHTELTGVVERSELITTDNVPVRWADGHRRGVFPHNIELIPEAPVLSTAKFNIGDKIVVFPHQWNIQYTSVSGPVVGEIIRILESATGRSAYHVEHKTSKGNTNAIWTDYREADNLIAHVSGPFQVGDQVVYTGEDTQEYKGHTDTVVAATDDWVSITDSLIRGGFPRNFSLLSRPTEPDTESVPEDTPADGELQALRERLLALAVKAYVDEAHQSIVETARMFENYITGGTK